MPRAINQATSRARRKKILKAVKGARLGRRVQLRAARHNLHKALIYAYRDRRNRKRDFRKLWITRIGAAAKQEGFSYSKLMGGLHKAGIEIDRKQLAELAVNDQKAFKELVEIARAA